MPHLLGVGVLRGVMAIVHSVYHYVMYHADSYNQLLVQIDLSNAFNQVSCHVVLLLVEVVCLSILSWVTYTVYYQSLLS